MTDEELIERLADKEHASWARWMVHLFSKCEVRADGSLIVPAGYAEAWRKQAETPYGLLSEQERQYDRDEVAHILPIIHSSSKHNAAMREIVAAVATKEMAFDDDWGSAYCIFGCSQPDDAVFVPSEFHHADDCPVTKARALLGLETE